MSLTPGQLLAREQLEEIQRAQDGGLELLHYLPTAAGRNWASALVSVPCWDMLRAPGGLSLRDRERIEIFVPPDFPFRPPSAMVPHRRFAGFHHVQWMSHLCLYISVATEWDASDGMYGFISRLENWLRLGALNQLDPAGAPLHPPVAYPQVDKLVIPRANTPAVGEEAWTGLAHLRVVSERRADVVGWSDLFADAIPETVGAAILLPANLPFEYPEMAKDLLDHLERQGVSRRLVLLTLAIAALRNREDDPLYVLVGAPMRGTSGAAERQQHLTAWYIEPEMARGLRLVFKKYSEHEEIRAIGEEIERLMAEWLEAVEVGWAAVREDRPEVLVRRDEGAPMAWFRGKAVALWGSGAVGGPIAEYLVRAGVRSILVRDRGVVTPGLLARQLFDEEHIGQSKADVTVERLKEIRPHDLEVRSIRCNLLDDPLECEDWTDGADVMIDASAAGAVIDKLELRRRSGARRVPVVSITIDHRAERGLAVIASAEHTGGPVDVLRRVKLEACGRNELRHFVDAFWPAEQRGEVFQPEPGCSESTFVGSAADTASLAAALLNLSAVELARATDLTASAHMITQPHVGLRDGQARQADVALHPDIVAVDPHSQFEIRISTPAWRDILGWIDRSRRIDGFGVETGGVLFGERDDAAGIIWVSEVTGPPPDSEASEDLFVCGIEGVAEANDEKRDRTRRSVQYIGMWHSHPDAAPVPSPRDFDGMWRLVGAERPSTPKPLLLIVGTNSLGAPPMIGAFVFTEADFKDVPERLPLRVVAVDEAPPLPIPRRDVGIALSGGGSRAIAFHLGCLRALYDRGVLDRTQVISAVSGGAVVAGMYAYGDGNFDEFEQRVVDLLKVGLARSIFREAILSPRAWIEWPEMLLSGALAAGASAFRVRPPLRRHRSRTTAFERALVARVFGDARLTDRRRGGIEVVFNACELRTGTAFRFGSRESGNWRFGKLIDNAIPVAHAVAASAAYPALLPAIDERFHLLRRDGREMHERLLLTDGGVYDNFGVSCLEPGRSDVHGYNTFRPDYIVCCDAGQGQFDGDVYPYWWPSRMKRSFETIFRKAHDATRSRLHEHAVRGRLKGFILPYLGQQDDRLPYISPHLVRRNEVADYPTDFSPMSDRMIEMLARRGEQLTRVLLSRYCPEL